MHAVFVVSKIDPTRAEEAEAQLKNRVAPFIQDAPGFIMATWARSADGKEGRSMGLFESEEAARSTLTAVLEGLPDDGPVTIQESMVYEVNVHVQAD